MPFARRRWPLARMLAVMRAFHQTHGRWPTEHDCNRSRALPHISTVHRRLREAGIMGGLKALVEMAEQREED